MSRELTEKSTILKKYLIKRQQVREEPIPQHSSIFRLAPHTNEELNDNRDHLKKYQTMSTNADHSQLMQVSMAETIILPSHTLREETKETLPHISIPLKQSQADLSISKTLDPQTLLGKAKQKKLGIHFCDPLYIRLEKDHCQRVEKKHRNYRKKWLDLDGRRKGKSLLERSREKTIENLELVNEDA